MAPLCAGPYGDLDSPQKPMRRLAGGIKKFGLLACDTLLDVRGLFLLTDKAGQDSGQTVLYLPDAYRIESAMMCAGEIYDLSYHQDEDGEPLLLLTAAEEAYMMAVSILRRLNINAYPAYLIDEDSGDLRLAVFIRDLDPDRVLSFTCLYEDEFSFRDVIVLGDDGATALMYAVAAENTLKYLRTLAGSPYIDLLELSTDLGGLTSALLGLAAKFDDNCIKAGSVGRLLFECLAGIEASRSARAVLNSWDLTRCMGIEAFTGPDLFDPRPAEGRKS